MVPTAYLRTGTRGSGLASAPGVFTAQFILFGMVLAQLADALTFTIGVSRFGIGLESNGIAVALQGLSGISAGLLAKLAVILMGIAILVLAANRFPRLLVWGGAAAPSLGLLGLLGLLGFAANGLSLAILG